MLATFEDMQTTWLVK